MAKKIKIKNFIKQIMNTYKDGLKYPFLKEQYDKLFKYNEELLDKLFVQEKKYDDLKKELKSLLKKKELDILSLKSWYESKYGSESWFYDFDGKGVKDVKRSLRVSKKGKEVLSLLAHKIDKMFPSNTPTQVVEGVIRFFERRKEWVYMTDEELYRRKEFWQLAEKSCELRKGDCDDLAILMHVLIKLILDFNGWSSHYWRLKLAVGTLVNYGGHAFNIWLGDDGEWYVVESTYDLKGSFSKTWLKTPIRNNNLYRSFWGFSRSDRSFKARADSLEPYKKKILG